MTSCNLSALATLARGICPCLCMAGFVLCMAGIATLASGFVPQ